VKKYIDILIELNLIRVGNAGVYYYKNDKHKKPWESRNTYVLYDVDGRWEDELAESIKIYKGMYKDRTFIKNYKNNDKSENGYISRINQLEKQSKATPYQLKKRDRLLEKKQKQKLDDEDVLKFQIKSLFENPDYKGSYLPDIYENLGRMNLKEKYDDIENKLGVWSMDGYPLIDYGYYMWLMINYNENQHDYYYNCVQKRIKDNLYSKKVLVNSNESEVNN